MDEWYSVAEAARDLGISDRRVRQLVEAGDLESTQVGSHRLIAAASVRWRAAHRPEAGRPVSQVLAWHLIAALGRDDGEALRSVADRRLRHRLRGLLDVERPVQEWALLLRRRATVHRYWGHPDLRRDLLEDERVSPAGTDAAAALGLGIGGGSGVSVYVSERFLVDIGHDYALEPDPRGDVLLRSFAANPGPAPLPGRSAPVAAVALDLMESVDVRSRAAGQAWFAPALERLRSDVKS